MFYRSFLITLLLAGCANAPNSQTQTETIDHKGIQKVILSNKSYIRECYGKTLAKPGNELLRGRVVLSFVIKPNGQTDQIKAVSKPDHLNNKHLTECLIVGLKTWTFPTHPLGKDVSVNFPFVFKGDPPSNMQEKLNRFESLKK